MKVQTNNNGYKCIMQLSICIFNGAYICTSPFVSNKRVYNSANFSQEYISTFITNKTLYKMPFFWSPSCHNLTALVPF